LTTQLPKPVPTGSDDYYRHRRADFARRTPDGVPPSYYLDFGDKCLHQFRRTEPDLTPEGQRWLQRTLVDLQVRMEQLRSDDPTAFGRLELDGKSFKNCAFEMHSEAYLASGIADLPLGDLRKIAGTPDAADLLTPSGQKEIAQVVRATAAKQLITKPWRWFTQQISKVSSTLHR
jgi:hypothetical protein